MDSTHREAKDLTLYPTFPFQKLLTLWRAMKHWSRIVFAPSAFLSFLEILYRRAVSYHLIAQYCSQMIVRLAVLHPLDVFVRSIRKVLSYGHGQHELFSS